MLSSSGSYQNVPVVLGPSKMFLCFWDLVNLLPIGKKQKYKNKKLMMNCFFPSFLWDLEILSPFGRFRHYASGLRIWQTCLRFLDLKICIQFCGLDVLFTRFVGLEILPTLHGL